MKENCFKLTNERTWRYPAQTITNADNTDDIRLLAKAPAQAETLLYSLEWAAQSIGLHVNAYKTEYMCFNQRDDICTLNDRSLKLVDKSSYIGSRVSSTETDINTRVVKARQLSIGYRSYGSQTWPIKWNAIFFPRSGHVNTPVW